jgi:type IV pilus assembly protein PilW
MVELLVALALTGMLLAGVVAIFLGWRSSSEVDERLAKIQERGQEALELLSAGIRTAGFQGCSQSPAHVHSSLLDAADPRWNFTGAPLQGYDAAGDGQWTPALPAPLQQSGLAPSDIILLRGPPSGAAPMSVRESMARPDAPIRMRTAPDAILQAGDVAMIYTCDAVSYFAVSSVTQGNILHTVTAADDTGPGNAVDSLQYAFGVGAEILPMESSVFYVAASANTAVPSLWRRVGNSAPRQMIQGVEDMQLRFGLDIDNEGIVDDYVPASDISDWSSVKSVSITLRLRLHHPSIRNGQVEITPSNDDSSPVQTFTTVVALRNSSRVH